MRLLKEGGLLNPAFLSSAKPSMAIQSKGFGNTPAPIALSSIPDMPPTGVVGVQFNNYYETIMLVRRLMKGWEQSFFMNVLLLKVFGCWEAAQSMDCLLAFLLH